MSRFNVRVPRRHAGRRQPSTLALAWVLGLAALTSPTAVAAPNPSDEGCNQDDECRGHFINVTSAGGAIHSPGLATYVASKHAATGFARGVREELVGTGVTVSVVMPSAVQTELVSGIPFKRWERRGIVTPESVAQRAVGTLRRRPAVVGAPRGTVAAVRAYHIVPEWLWLLGRRVVGADRTVQPYDKTARKAYDTRIEVQVRDDEVPVPDEALEHDYQTQVSDEGERVADEA